MVEVEGEVEGSQYMHLSEGVRITFNWPMAPTLALVLSQWTKSNKWTP